MSAFYCRVQALWFDRRAVTALEYGIIASALGVALLAIFARLATPISLALSDVGSSI
jgi:Flp pilus assembly pilin Flp